MTTQQAKICPTCQFVAPTDQDDHSCLDHLQKVSKRLIEERAGLFDLLDRVRAIADEALQFYVHNQKPPDNPINCLPFIEALVEEITPTTVCGEPERR